jgi:membrane fusion protein (multidrug efflux system)/multidrug efflux system membrane fusion protein
LLVEQRAVESSQGVNYVWVIDDNSVAHYRRVEVREVFGSQFIIDNGVQAGERVALTGGQKLHEGMKVTPIIKR